MLRAVRRGTASRMNFGKFAFGALILAIGVLLLAVRVGFAHPDTPMFLLRYWPLLRQSTVALDKVRSLSVEVRTFAGRFNIGGGTPPSKGISVRVRGDFAGGYRFAASDGKAVFEWPRHIGILGVQSPGTSLDVGVPEALPVTLTWYGQLASVHADLTRLEPTSCAFKGIASSILLGIKAAAAPEEVRIWGLFSNVTIRVHGDCPVRLVSHGPFVMRALPSDFEELAPGRGKDRVDAAEGRGRPVRIDVEGMFVRVKIERLPLTAVMTEEESEWYQLESTASRSLSPSS